MVQHDSISNRQGDIDPKLMKFLHEKVNTFVRWDLIRFFNDNPHAKETAANIAQFTGREVGPVENELVGLVEDNVLNMQTAGHVTVFSLSSDPAIRDVVKHFVLACDDRQFRVEAINQVIRAMR